MIFLVLFYVFIIILLYKDFRLYMRIPDSLFSLSDPLFCISNKAYCYNCTQEQLYPVTVCDTCSDFLLLLAS